MLANISYHKLWESEFDTIVSKKDKVQEMKINQFNSKYMMFIRLMNK